MTALSTSTASLACSEASRLSPADSQIVTKGDERRDVDDVLRVVPQMRQQFQGSGHR
jgi:hypothetical protein